MFNAGRVFWQAFPSRFDPTPLLPAMIKNHRLGRSTGKGFYDYEDGQRSQELAAASQNLVQKYQRNVIEFSDSEIIELLTIPMWIEAAIAFREGVTESMEQFDHAMRGGLGFDPNSSWLEFFDQLTSDRISKSIAKWSPSVKAMSAPEELCSLLSQHQPRETLRQFSRQ
jgi:3-hydroxyacyl-CoA dehydrogenase